MLRTQTVLKIEEERTESFDIKLIKDHPTPTFPTFRKPLDVGEGQPSPPNLPITRRKPTMRFEQ
jgi:hypothetical protein